MAGTTDELKKFALWQLERIEKGEDPRDFWAFALYVQQTGGDIQRLGDYGWPNDITISAPPALPKA